MGWGKGAVKGSLGLALVEGTNTTSWDVGKNEDMTHRSREGRLAGLSFRPET